MAEAFASANAVAEDLSNELFVKGDSIAADAVAKQIAITRQVLRTIFHFLFMYITTHMRVSVRMISPVCASMRTIPPWGI